MKIQNKKWKTAARKTGEAALRFLYPPRCPLCDKICPARVSPARSASEWRHDLPLSEARGRYQSAFKWADRPAAERSEGALPKIRPISFYMVCEDCRGKLPWVSEPACMKCGKPVGSPEREFCEDCERTLHLFDQGRAAFTYSGSMRKSVYRMKFQNRRDYLDFYAEAMVYAGERHLCFWRPEVIVPVPMHWKKRAARGYNQSELLAVRISRLTGIPCERKLLRCVRYTGDQKELGRNERLRNLRGSFEVCSPNRLNRILLVDDVYTTGSTMDEAARALRAAGARQLFFLVLCTGKGKKSLHDTKSVLY